MTDPADEYRRRLDARRATAATLAARIDRLGQWRLALVLLGVGGAAVGSWTGQYPAWVGALFLAPVALLFFLALRLTNLKRWYDRLARYHELGVRRVSGEWVGTGNAGERFVDASHLAAVDLDLFGRGSLFERVCTARTAEGETKLAEWFNAPSDAATILDRQRAVAELRPRLDLREALAAAGAEATEGVDFSALARWGEKPRQSPAEWRRHAVFAFGWVNLLTCAAWLALGIPLGVLVITLVVSVVILYPMFGWLSDVVKPVEHASRNLSLLGTILARFEAEPFASPRLVAIQSGLRSDGVRPSVQLQRLAALAEWLAARRNVMFLPLRILLLWDARMAFAIERWRRQSGPLIRAWLEAVAEMEALSSLAAYSFENPADPFPEVTDSPPQFVAARLGHPLMPLTACVRNDVRLDDGTRLLVVSGSNMSGKSTLLRAIGVNSVLALAGGPVRADSLAISPLRLAATLRVQDSLSDGKSRFFAEVVRVKAALEAARNGPVLFLFDELFAGTNSADRVRGAAGVIRAMLDAGAIGLLTTHDLAVTELPEVVRERVSNVHFADQWVDGEMRFDYSMRAGVVPHTNGVALMRAVGLDV